MFEIALLVGHGGLVGYRRILVGTGGGFVSDVVRQAVAGKDFEFEDRGELELKGFDQPVRAWVVRWHA